MHKITEYDLILLAHLINDLFEVFEDNYATFLLKILENLFIDNFPNNLALQDTLVDIIHIGGVKC